ANKVLIRSAHDDETATIGRDCGVGALVEEDGIVLDVAIEGEPDMADAAAISTAQIAAYPVVVELVIVGAGADADAARTRRTGREQFIAGGRIPCDIVVMDIQIDVFAVWQNSVRYRAVLARAWRSI